MDLYLDPGTGDLALTLGDIRLTDGLAETAAQRLKIALQTFLGEWFLDTLIGVPYYRDILVKNPDLSLIRSLFKRLILDDPDVEAVPRLDLDFDPAARKLDVDFDAVLLDETVVSVSISSDNTTVMDNGAGPFPILF